MTYAEAIEHLHALGPELSTSRRKFDLAHMRTLCVALGTPQDKVPAILIAGTNGKGSTAATLASILTAAGYRTGLYTSPHLHTVNERIRLAQNAISDHDFAHIYTQVDEAATILVASGELPWPPSFFERLTAVAFTYFSIRAQITVLEVGLGGRLDATNVVEPLFAILTDIALDHQDYLGNTLTEIAREKCGILRQDGTVITLSQHPAANQVIGEEAQRLNVLGVSAAEYLPPARRNSSETVAGSSPWENRYRLALQDAAEPGELLVDSPLAGEHQQRNLALAIAAVVELRNHHGYNITNTAIAQGIRGTEWPARLEFLSPNLLLDVAHNPAGAWTLRAAIGKLPPDQPRTLIFSCLRDKNLEEISRILFPLFDSSAGDPQRSHDHIILAPISNARAASVTDLVTAAHILGVPAHAAPHLEGALAQARQITPPGGLIVATGSIFLVAEIRQLALA